MLDYADKPDTNHFGDDCDGNAGVDVDAFAVVVPTCSGDDRRKLGEDIDVPIGITILKCVYEHHEESRKLEGHITPLIDGGVFSGVVYPDGYLHAAETTGHGVMEGYIEGAHYHENERKLESDVSMGLLTSSPTQCFGENPEENIASGQFLLMKNDNTDSAPTRKLDSIFYTGAEISDICDCYFFDYCNELV